MSTKNKKNTTPSSINIRRVVRKHPAIVASGLLVLVVVLFLLYYFLGLQEYGGEGKGEVSIGDILDHPYKYANKSVVLHVKYAGWTCPNGKISYPSFLSRSAFFWYDGTGCIYGGRIIEGKLMIPQWHKANEMGNESIVIEGIVRVNSRGEVWLE